MQIQLFPVRKPQSYLHQHRHSAQIRRIQQSLAALTMRIVMAHISTMKIAMGIIHLVKIAITADRAITMAVKADRACTTETDITEGRTTQIYRISCIMEA